MNRLVGEFRGTKRFKIEKRLGMGGMGVVYAAHDQDSNTRVALKTLLSASPAAVLRFKREFHALHDIQHPNLVSLGELHEDEGILFFTMELVEGVSFLDYLRPGSPRPTPGDEDRDERDGPISATALTPTASPAQLLYQAAVSAPRPRIDEARLRSGLAQLVRGLIALHNAGRIHRDVKPSNILVAKNGRVVLLDFGLVAEADIGASLTDGGAVGTAIYMAPEQALGDAVDVKADWYAVGVLLYEALVGAPPYLGSNLKILIDKQRTAPARPRTLAPNVPEDLDQLCMELLRAEPERRPSGEAILRRLGIADKPSITRMAPLARASVHTQTQLLVGREAEHAQLQAALDDTRAGRQVSVYVNGESGIGKSTLVRAFTQAAATDESVIALTGRCYERDSVPYKALDGVIDMLSRTLQRLPKQVASSLLPRRASLLLQVFPVLRHVDVLAEAPPHEVVDPHELRKLVFAGLRELFHRIAERFTLIVAIDDLQWADSDGLALLAELLRTPEAPPFLLLATWRDAGEQGGLAERLAGLPGEARHIKLSPLSRAAAEELTTALIVRANESGYAGLADVQSIAREAGGHPLFIDELVRASVLVDPRAERSTGPGVRLEDVLAMRIANLEPAARAILEVAAIAANPVEQEIAARAVGMTPAVFGRQATVLRAMNLVRTTQSSVGDTIETYHDRVRSAVMARLSRADRQARHRELARALASSGRADPEALVEHYCGAQELDKAGNCAIDAAHAAARALAFGRAARLYQLALALLPEDYPGRRTLRVALGDVLTSSGRGAEAAQAYSAATAGATAAEALDLRRRAAQQLLVTGHIDEGLSAMREVLAMEGIPYPATPRRALLSIVAQRAWLRVRGMGFRERDESLVTAKELTQLDVCLNVGLTLGTADTIRGFAFHVASLRLALRAGEPYRLGLSLAIEAGSLSALGPAGQRRAEQLIGTATGLAQKVDRPHLHAFIVGVRGQKAYFEGRYRDAVALCEEAETMLSERCVGVPWESSTVRLWRARSLVALGQLRFLQSYVSAAIRECADRSDLFGATSLSLAVLPFVHLAEDDVALARQNIADSARRWSTAGFHLQHYYASFARTSSLLYEGDAAAADAELAPIWPQLVGARLTRVQTIRVAMADLGGRIALALAAGSTKDRPARLTEAARRARFIERDGARTGQPQAQLLRAQIAHLRDDRDEARRHLEQAAQGFDGLDMALHAAVARRCLGLVVGGPEGARLIAEADHFMRTETIRAPERMARMLAPAFGG